MLCCCVIGQCKILLDLKFGLELLVKFVNILMVDGKKFIVEFIVYSVLEILVQCFGKFELEVFEVVFENVCLIVEVKFCCVGGFIYQVLVEVCLVCCNVLVMCWIVEVVCKCGDKFMVLCLVNEFFDVVENKGIVVKKCEDVYCMVEVYKVFVYYCWLFFWSFSYQVGVFSKQFVLGYLN